MEESGGENLRREGGREGGRVAIGGRLEPNVLYVRLGGGREEGRERGPGERWPD